MLFDKGRHHVNPSHIWIEPTNRCNTRCRDCRHYYEVFGQDLDRNTYEVIRDSVLPFVNHVDLLGYGEPLVSPLFEEMLEECLSRGIHVGTISNGILLRSPERARKIVRDNVTLAISIDGAHAETFEFVRPYVKWKGMLETLEQIRHHAGALPKEANFSLVFNLVPMKKNIGDLPDMVRLAAKYGAQAINMLPFVTDHVSPDMREETLDNCPDLVNRSLIRARELALKHNVHLSIPSVLLEISDNAKSLDSVFRRAMFFIRRAMRKAARVCRNNAGSLHRQPQEKILFHKDGKPSGPAIAFCPMPWRDSFFGVDGSVYSCCIIRDKLGNVKEQRWDDIWNGSAYRSLRRTIHGWNPTEKCRTCAVASGVNGGDAYRYKKYFAKYRVEDIPLDSPLLTDIHGLYGVERSPDGKITHRWASGTCSFSVPARRGAKFLRLLIVQRTPFPAFNSGMLQINDGPEEYFDNSCPELHFPLGHATGDTLRIQLQMEQSGRFGDDSRELGLPICGMQYLF